METQCETPDLVRDDAQLLVVEDVAILEQILQKLACADSLLTWRTGLK